MDVAFIQAMLKEQDKGNRVDGTFTSQAYADMVDELSIRHKSHYIITDLAVRGMYDSEQKLKTLRLSICILSLIIGSNATFDFLYQLCPNGPPQSGLLSIKALAHQMKKA
ncbi:hypothetical protein L6452_28152 [Arctium lappa]|uniref:Uncharacterized protein n=1 Tax=Arctium lappa TaxID=4217 RepID=A0ACB8ZYI1_ARCLA|nr:hypothetical protein L6452_28152 [Arctium lappa]